ncbi:MAG: Sip1-related alpha-galactosidase [Ignisphaera sp.]|nr:raffinose synthase [Ignisphaera sp.]MDW8084741.1 Sip1-related alpha-galactosidase [Ignisphaera sp.]
MEGNVSASGVGLRIAGAELIFADGSRESCRLSEGYVYKCASGSIAINVDGGLISVAVSSVKPLSSTFFAELILDTRAGCRALALTLHPEVSSIYTPAFRYYNPLAVDRQPTSSKPDDNPIYPPRLSAINHYEFARRFPCWTYPVISPLESVPDYTVFVLAELDGGYTALLSLSSGDVTAYIGPGARIRLFLGREGYQVKESRILSIGASNNPYDAVYRCVEAAARVGVLKLRMNKKKPGFIDKLGWCSWNALLTEDLSHENVVRIVRGLLDRGIPLGWIIVDDGWQSEVRKGEEFNLRVLRDLSANERFPRGLKGLVDEIRKLGVGDVGLWHTINIHWGGFEETVARKLGVECHRFPLADSYVPPPQIGKAIEFYGRFYKWVRENGFSLVKVDNQWSIHALYWGETTVGEASRNVQIALQVGAAVNGLEILNCMSMAPEDYSNYFMSNVMRVSMDYIPFWKGDAKLHTVFSIYNSLLFSHIAYPDYDMWMSYDPYAKVHAVARVFSGGPIYLTDRHPEKTDADLIKRLVLDDGETVKVCEPGLPTRDVLLRDPYNEPILLKTASRVGEAYAIALFNVNRAGIEISEDIALDILPYKLEHDRYVYYMVFSGRMGTVGRGEKIGVDLRELDAEAIIIVPIDGGRAAVGLKEYILPPYPLEISRHGRKMYVKSRASGTLVYYVDGEFKEMKIEKNQVVEV